MGSANTPNKRPEPVSGYQFQVFVSNIRMGFSKVTNIEESIETQAFQEGGVNDRAYTLCRPVTAERTLVFERGLGSRSQLKDLLGGRSAVGRRILPDILILVGARTGKVSHIYQVHGAVIKRWSLGELDALSSQVVIERFELAYETLEACPVSKSLAGRAMASLRAEDL